MGSCFLLCRRLRWFWTKQLTELIHQVSRESVSKNQVALFPVQSNGQRSTLGVLKHFFAGLCPSVTLSLSVFFCSAPAWRNPSGGWWGWPSWGVSEVTLGARCAHNCDLLAKWNTCRARGSTGSNLFWYLLFEATHQRKGPNSAAKIWRKRMKKRQQQVFILKVVFSSFRSSIIFTAAYTWF